MSEYDIVRRGKLVLKGLGDKAKKRKHKKSRKDTEASSSKDDTDAINHGGWWKVDKLDDVKGGLAIQWGNAYVAALDNGLLALGAPRGLEGPTPEEILTAVPAGSRSVAFKSGYGKFLGVDHAGRVTARADAVGPREQWEPIWENGKMAILNSTGKFMSIDSSDDSLIAKSEKATDDEHCTIRSQASRVIDKVSLIPVEERGNLNEIEENYVKKFQKFQDKKIKLNQDSHEDLKRARTDGNFHETLLDRRSKMKADRYCK